MNALTGMMAELEEASVAQQVSILFDNARVAYRLDVNTVHGYDEFQTIIGNFVNHLHARCVSHGGSLSAAEARGRGKEAIEAEYRRRRSGDIVTAFRDAQQGTNGGMRVLLDIITEREKAAAIERYVRDVFDRHVNPADWDQKIALMKQFFAVYSETLPSSIDRKNPERYAQNYGEIIRSYVDALKATSSVLRRL